MFERIKLRIIKGRQLIPLATANVLQEHEDRIAALESGNSNDDNSSGGSDSGNSSSGSGSGNQESQSPEPQSQTLESGRDISFSITNNGTPVEGATVTIDEISGTTGSAGGCTLKNVHDGQHVIYIDVGDDQYSTNIEVSEDSVNFNIELSEIEKREYPSPPTG